MLWHKPLPSFHPAELSSHLYAVLIVHLDNQDSAATKSVRIVAAECNNLHIVLHSATTATMCTVQQIGP